VVLQNLRHYSRISQKGYIEIYVTEIYVIEIYVIEIYEIEIYVIESEIFRNIFLKTIKPCFLYKINIYSYIYPFFEDN
jgi:hypothetical protein